VPGPCACTRKRKKKEKKSPPDGHGSVQKGGGNFPGEGCRNKRHFPEKEIADWRKPSRSGNDLIHPDEGRGGEKIREKQSPGHDIKKKRRGVLKDTVPQETVGGASPEKKDGRHRVGGHNVGKKKRRGCCRKKTPRVLFLLLKGKGREKYGLVVAKVGPGACVDGVPLTLQ